MYKKQIEYVPVINKGFQEIKSMFNTLDSKVQVAIHFAVVVYLVNNGVVEEEIKSKKLVTDVDLLSLRTDLFTLNEYVMSDIKLFESLLKMYVDTLNNRLGVKSNYKGMLDILGIDDGMDQYYRSCVDENIDMFNTMVELLNRVFFDKE